MTREELLKDLPKIYTKSKRIDGNIHNPKSKSYCPELLKEIDDYTENFKDATFSEKIYIIKNDIKERPKCYCGNELKWKNNKQGYITYCSAKCQRNAPERIEHIKELWKNKTPEEKQRLTDKTKSTKLKRYGDENYNNPQQISETNLSKDQEYWDIRNEKQFKTKEERYGYKYYCNGDKISETWKSKTDEELKEIQQKTKETNLEKYGVEHLMQLDEYKEKMKETFIEHYGVDHPMRCQEVKDKIQQTKSDNGTLQNNPEVIAKAKETNIQKYNGVTFTATPEGKQQVINTSLERYGVTNYTKTDEYPIKIKQAWQNKSPEEIDEIANQRKETCLDKYGVDSYPKSNSSKIFYYEKNYKQYILRYAENNIEVLTSKNDYINNRLISKFNEVKLKCKICDEEWEARLGVNGTTSICRKCHPYKFIKEREIGEFLEEIGINIKYKDRALIYPYEIDVLLSDFKIGIEFNGLMFHSFGKSKHTMFNNYFQENELKYKHLDKTKMVEDKGYQLFHINENEWDNLKKQDIWKSLILNKLGLNTRIFARKCIIEEIDSKTAREFLEENHLQGYINSQIKIGLYYNKELVSVMTFSKPRYNKNVEYELIRFASKKYFNIIGGASKLLTYFERNYKPKNLLSYANRRWSTGNVYDKLNFDFIEATNPNYFYFYKDMILESRVKYQKHKLQEILSNFDSSLTESENMYNNNYRKIYDCGNLKYIKEYTYV